MANVNSVNNLAPIDDQSFCDLLANCQLGAAAARIGSAVADFFTFVIVSIYQALVLGCQAMDYVLSCQCCNEEDGDGENNPVIGNFNEGPHIGFNLFDIDQMGGWAPRFVPRNRDNGVAWGAMAADAPAIAVTQIKEEAPTKELAHERRVQALSALEQLKSADGKTKFECPIAISHFNLDAVLQKYGTDKPPATLLQWYDYAGLDRGNKENVQRILQNFGYNSSSQHKAVQNLVSKLHYILVDKRTRVEKLSGDAKTEAQKALNQEIQYIFSRLVDADNNCIDQSLSQLEDIIIDVIASENPLGKNSTLNLLHFQAAHALFRYRAQLIKLLLAKDPDLKDRYQAAHMADIEREVKKKLAEMMGMKGEIIQAGAAFGGMVSEQAATAAEKLAPRFFEQYNPAQYLQEQCQVVFGLTRGLRNNLLQWATNHYDLEGEDETLAKAVVKDQKAYEELVSVAAVDLTIPGTQLFLEAAGIIQRA